jgi:4-hydroxy-2-oxoglutarate aldolase
MAKRFSGIIAPVTTPFKNEEVMFDEFRENMKKYSKTPLAGFFVIGSNGESKSLNESEKFKLLEIAIDEKSESQLIMAGTAYESTRETIEASKKAQEMGADIVSLVSPSYFKKRLTDDALIGFYKDVAEALSIPVFAYNAPGFTGLTLSPRVVEEISKHPNVAGMKDTSPAGIARYLEVCSDDFDVFAGTVNTLIIGLFLGASGGVVSLGNAFPEPCCELYEKFIQGDVEEAKALHHKLFNLNAFVSGKFGVAGVKYCMELGGYNGGPPRLPLLPLEDGDKKVIEKAVSASGIM